MGKLESAREIVDRAEATAHEAHRVGHEALSEGQELLQMLFNIM